MIKRRRTFVDSKYPGRVFCSPEHVFITNGGHGHEDCETSMIIALIQAYERKEDIGSHIERLSHRIGYEMKGDVVQWNTVPSDVGNLIGSFCLPYREWTNRMIELYTPAPVLEMCKRFGICPTQRKKLLDYVITNYNHIVSEINATDTCCIKYFQKPLSKNCNLTYQFFYIWHAIKCRYPKACFEFAKTYYGNLDIYPNVSNINNPRPETTLGRDLVVDPKIGHVKIVYFTNEEFKATRVPNGE
jgi:hypothetical protein